MKATSVGRASRSDDAFVWIPTTKRLPEVCKPVIGYADKWVDSEYNEMGMRECFRSDEEWQSANWNNYQDCWDVEVGPPDYWMPYPGTPSDRTSRKESSVSDGGCSPGSESPQNPPFASGVEKWTVEDCPQSIPKLYNINTGRCVLQMVTDDYQMACDICSEVAASVSLAEARTFERVINEVAKQRHGGTGLCCELRLQAEARVQEAERNLWNRIKELEKGIVGQEQAAVRLAEAERLVRFYAGEGREQRPDMIEWRALADKKRRTKAEQARLNEICRAVEVEDMDAPERRAEIESLRARLAEAERQLKYMEGNYKALKELFELNPTALYARLAEAERKLEAGR